MRGEGGFVGFAKMIEESGAVVVGAGEPYERFSLRKASDDLRMSF